MCALSVTAKRVHALLIGAFAPTVPLLACKETLGPCGWAGHAQSQLLAESIQEADGLPAHYLHFLRLLYILTSFFKGAVWRGCG